MVTFSLNTRINDKFKENCLTHYEIKDKKQKKNIFC